MSQREATLEDFFRTRTPPSRGVEIIKFWEALFGLLDELKGFHPRGGIYANVSPESILVVKDGTDGQLACRFNFMDSNADQSTLITSTNCEKYSDYYAPEIYSSVIQTEISQDLPLRTTSSADIWSLGCVYSEAAIWIADGYTGIEEYRLQRQLEANSAFPLSKAQNIFPFHDGTEVLRCVLDAHTDIEDRLRRSDSITKNVLDMMVQEMLWEEERPGGKALLRKADIVLMKARQKSGVRPNNASEMVRSGSRQRREYPPPQLPSPTQPLPPLPDHAASILNLASERSISGEAARGKPHNRVFDRQLRANATADKLGRLMATSRPDSQQDINNTGQLPRADKQAAIEIESWKLPSDAASTRPLVLSQKTHPNAGIPHRPTPNQGRPRALRMEASREFMPRVLKPQEPKPSRDQHTRPITPSITKEAPPQTQTLNQTISTPQSRVARTSHVPEHIVPSRAESFSSSHKSSIYSQLTHSPSGQDDSFLEALSYVPTADEISQETKPSKRGIGFSLFPTRSRHESSAPRRRIHDFSVPQSPSLSSGAVTQNLEYISLNTCLEWKKANKKVKKHANVPPLLSVGLMEELSGRDHAFIVDDSASMAPVWADVQRVFEALSYTVKGMSPEGTELFFTISYDTYQRKDTSELCTHLSAHSSKGQTNILYRLNLQLQAYRLKLLRAKTPPKTKSKKPPAVPFVPAKVRPLSIYILTNGEWSGDGDRGVEEVQDAMRTMSEFLKSEELDAGSVSVQFVSFGGSAGAMRRLGGLRREAAGNGGLAVDCERWTGNVVRMLRGAMEGGRGVGEINELA